MSDLNQCQFIGRLGKDPEMRATSNGNAVCNLSIAVSDTWKDKNNGEKKGKTEWVRGVVWGKLAEICGQYLAKGSQVYIAGRMETRKWQDKDGQNRYSTEINIKDMQMLGSKGDAQQPKDYPENAVKQTAPVADAFEDDIPF